MIHALFSFVFKHDEQAMHGIVSPTLLHTDAIVA